MANIRLFNLKNHDDTVFVCYRVK